MDPVNDLEKINIRKLHNVLSLMLKKAIRSEQLTDLKHYFSGWALKEGELEAMDNFLDLWKKLEKIGMIKPMDYQQFEEAISAIDSFCLLDIIDDYKGKMTSEVKKWAFRIRPRSFEDYGRYAAFLEHLVQSIIPAGAFEGWILDNRVICTKTMMNQLLGDYALVMEHGSHGVVFHNAVIGRITQQGGSIRLRNGTVTLHIPEQAILPLDPTVNDAEPRIFWILRSHADALEIYEQELYASPGNEQVPPPDGIMKFSLPINFGPPDVTFRNKVKLTVKHFCQKNVETDHGNTLSLYRKKDANSSWERVGLCDIDWQTRIATLELSCFSSYVVGAPTCALSESSYGLSIRLLLSRDSVNNISVFIALNDSSYIEEFITRRRLSVARETCLYIDLKYDLIVTWVKRSQKGPSSQKQGVLPVKHLHNLSEKLAHIRLAVPATQDTGPHKDVLTLSQNGNEVLKLPFKREAALYSTETKAPEVIDTVDEELKVVLPVKPMPDTQETGPHEDVLTLSQKGNQVMERPFKRETANYPTETKAPEVIDTADAELKGQQEQSKVQQAQPDTYKKILADTSTPQEALRQCDEKFKELFTTMITQHRAMAADYLDKLERNLQLEHGTQEKSLGLFRPQADGASLRSLELLPANEGREKVVMQGGERKGRAAGYTFSNLVSRSRGVGYDSEEDVSSDFESGYGTPSSFSVSSHLSSASSLTEIDEKFSVEFEKSSFEYFADVSDTCSIASLESGSSSSLGYPSSLKELSQNAVIKQKRPYYMRPVSELEQLLAFPLQGSHSWMIGCVKCLQPTGLHSYYEQVKAEHRCEENVLTIQRNGETYWQCVRVRIGKHDFRGNYQFCNQYTKGQTCTNQEPCSFAHNPYEKMLWTLEKFGKFNITDFIKRNRSDANKSTYSLQLLKEHGGDMMFLCKRCFFQNPSQISKQHDEMCEGGHQWSENRILVHEKRGRKTPIRDRPFTHRNAFFKMCYRHDKQICETEDCRFSHSLVEKAVWEVETDMGLTRDDIVKKCNREGLKQVEVKESYRVTRKYRDLSPPTKGKAAQHYRDLSPPSKGKAAHQCRDLSPPTKAVAAQQRRRRTISLDVTPKVQKCPYKVTFVCGLCMKNGQLNIIKSPTGDACAARAQHKWDLNKVAVCMPKNDIIRKLPSKIIPKTFAMCTAKKQCRRFPDCSFPHSDTEREIWTWQINAKVNSLEDLVKISAIDFNSAPRPQTKQQTDVKQYYCKYCAITCKGQRQWEDHRSSQSHEFNVNSDKGHQWNYRQPPWAVQGNYRLCRSTSGVYCPYSNIDDARNACTSAHSQEELDEWHERYKWRQMKIKLAKKEGAFSYMDELAAEHGQSESGISVLAESIEDIGIEPGHVTENTADKATSFDWTFRIETKGKKLKKVALLNNQHRLHFDIINGYTTCQVGLGGDFLKDRKAVGQEYEVKVHFNANMFGSFQQKIVFDFGTRPVVYRTLIVDVGTEDSLKKIMKLREQLSFERWTSDNREIVRLSEAVDEFDATICKKYRVSSSVEDVVTPASLSAELKDTNYKHMMHTFLRLEEMTQHSIISCFNLATTAELNDKIFDDSFLLAAPPGELFAKINLDDELTSDTDAGSLLLTTVSRVLIARKGQPSKKVFEVKFVEKDVFDFDGRGRERIYLHLHSACCQELELSDTTHEVDLEVQFQMNSLSFSRMHYALDQLQNTGHLLPDIARIEKGLTERKVLDISDFGNLNDTQINILKHISIFRKDYTPPMIVYGPFGTGKTETLARATIALTENLPKTKILICTQSNSAADWYISKYLKHLPQKGIGVKRVIATEKKPRHTNEDVLKCAFVSEDGSMFINPTKKDVEAQRVIVTTFTHSLLLTRLQLQGFFTHIFIDEAGQALECEVLIPLLLAVNNTCVVLAGDHLQIGPKIYSKEAERLGFHASMLERLFEYYQRQSRYLSRLSIPLNVLMTINYRSNQEIVSYLGETFYGGKLAAAESRLPVSKEIKSLAFTAVLGRETQESGSTSYNNVSEARQVCEAVNELLLHWPAEWGGKAADTIAVVTPYQNQVNHIRYHLRKAGLKGVIVERVQNIQGREFRAIFISTVRTQHICDNEPTETSNPQDFGFLTDKRLLNTAMTRAQSLVAVIGDPIALCSIGDCATVWRTFLERCQHLGNIRPSHVNLIKIKFAVSQFASNPKTERNLAVINDSLLRDRETRGRDSPMATNPKEGKGGRHRSRLRMFTKGPNDGKLAKLEEETDVTNVKKME